MSRSQGIGDGAEREEEVEFDRISGEIDRTFSWPFRMMLQENYLNTIRPQYLRFYRLCCC